MFAKFLSLGQQIAIGSMIKVTNYIGNENSFNAWCFHYICQEVSMPPIRSDLNQTLKVKQLF